VSSKSPQALSLTVIDTAGFERLLKKLARTFALSLRILPATLRPTLSLAYMLARASDSIADAATAPTFQRLALLRTGRAGDSSCARSSRGCSLRPRNGRRTVRRG
jgi:phytoene/squalene synthetase